MSTSASNRPPRHAAAPEPVVTERVAGPSAGPSIGELFSRVTEQMSRLVRDEIQLAQAQLTEKGKRMGTGVGLFGAAAFFGVFAFGVLLACAILGLSYLVAPWLAALIVALVLLLIAGICVLIGKKKIDAAKEVEAKPQEGIKQDIEAVKKGINK